MPQGASPQASFRCADSRQSHPPVLDFLAMQAFMGEAHPGKNGVLLASLGTIAELGEQLAQASGFVHCL